MRKRHSIKPKKKRFAVAYRRSTHDKRTYNYCQYVPHFLEIFYATRCTADPETLSRIKLDKKGRYIYRPSDQYYKMLVVEREKEVALEKAVERRAKLLNF